MPKGVHTKHRHKYKTEEERVAADKKSNRESMVRRRELKPLQNKLVTKRSDAKRKQLDFNITLEDLVVPEYCPYLGLPLKLSGDVADNLISLDRIDSSKGYVKGNVQIISMKANTMKSNASIEELVCFAKNVLKLHDQGNK